jgi:cytochrome c oxidase assembly protein subunit 15
MYCNLEISLNKNYFPPPASLILRSMKNNLNYIRYTWFVLALVFLVILAGGVVRMTQSGMGCPDWPKCFGRWIPPTRADQLPPDFEKYLSKQDIDHTFNVYHTWIEYINRLLGALLGLFIFIHTIWSFIRFRRINPAVAWLSFFMLLAVAFQGWLGKKVVDANLAAVKVTTHMLVALVIAALPVLIISKLKAVKTDAGKLLKSLSAAALLIIIIQIILGTQVREQIDVISKPLNYGRREIWIGKLDAVYFIHRSFSWIAAISCIMLLWKSKGYKNLRRHSLLAGFLVLLSILTGLVMNFLKMPAVAQPLHLLLASLLAVCLFGFWLRLK